jgi:hypothetical protein
MFNRIHISEMDREILDRYRRNEAIQELIRCGNQVEIRQTKARGLHQEATGRSKAAEEKSQTREVEQAGN